MLDIIVQISKSSIQSLMFSTVTIRGIGFWSTGVLSIFGGLVAIIFLLFLGGMLGDLILGFLSLRGVA